MLDKSTLVIVFLQFFAFDGISGQFNVTLAFFSGRPDPSWVVLKNNPQYTAVQQLLGQARKALTTYDPELMPSRLGYKGYLIQEGTKAQSELIVGYKETATLQRVLLQTIPKGMMKMDFSNRVLKQIDLLNVEPKVSRAMKHKRYAPVFAILPWSNAYTKRNNNCYNYANIVVTNTFAQPGLGSGAIYAAMTAVAVRNAAVNDGLAVVIPHPRNTQPVPQRPGGYQHLVALVVDPDAPGHNGDHHWYRLDSDGKWSHKPGQTSVTRTDDSRNRITDPRIADMGDYRFVCFMYSNRKTVTIA